jgi:hypothetical protein
MNVEIRRHRNNERRTKFVVLHPRGWRRKKERKENEKIESRETGKRTRRRRGYSICRARDWRDTVRRARGGG